MVTWDWNTYLYFLSALALSYPFLRKYDKCKNKKAIYLILGLLPTFCLLAFRDDSVGKDLIRYAVHVNNAIQVEISSLGFLQEPLFTIIEWISAKLGGMQAFLIITSALEYIFLGYGLKRLHEKGIKIVLVFYLFFGFVVIRSFSMVSNGVAISAAFCAYTYLLDYDSSEKRKYWLYTIIAVCFHRSAIIGVPLYFCCMPNLSENVRMRRRVNFIKVISLVAMLFLCFIIASGRINGLIMAIFSGEDSRLQVTSSGFGVGNIITRLPLLFLVWYAYKKINIQYGHSYDSFVYLVYFDLIVAQLKYMNQDFERFTMYTGLCVVFVIPVLYSLYRRSFRGAMQLVVAPAVIAYITHYLYYWAVIGEYGIMPYHFWR